jgi:4'-phosphopantetheinyl transferase
MLNTIYWMLVDSSQTLPEARTFLSPAELGQFSGFRFPKRRDDWLLGRWAAKSLAHSLPAYHDFPLDRIEIRNTPQGAPLIYVQDTPPTQDCLTISHSGSLALCALTSTPGLRVGADLEKIEPRTETFILEYFTPAECRLVDAYPAEVRAVVVTLIWCAKEAMLKALGVGLHWDTRTVEVRGLDGLPPAASHPSGWLKIQIGEVKATERIWSAWWRRHGQFVLTLAGLASTQKDILSAHLVEKSL